MPRIHIAGASGCGKTTYAKKLGKKLGIPVFHLDEIYHDDTVSPPAVRDEKVRLKILKDIIKKNRHWIIEGFSYSDWVNPALDKATQVHFMSTPRLVRSWRLICRYIKVKLNREQSNYRQTMHSLWKLLRATWGYETKIMPIVKSKIPTRARVVRVPYYK